MAQKLARLIVTDSFNKHSLLKLSIVSSVFAVGALMATPVQAANLIVNGSFEEGPDPGVFLPLFAVSTVIPGWRVSQGSIDLIGSIWVDSDGVRSIDLQGAGTGTIEQTFNTTVGATYRVTFDLAGNPGGPPTVKPMRVAAAGTSQDFTFDVTGKTFSNMGWVSRFWDFTANSTSTTLAFSGLDNTPFGAALDNVSVVAIAIPEPSSVLGLLGLGVLGIGSALKRKS